MNKNFSFKSVQKGFSLVELLVVIAVIAIIAAIAIPNISQITQQAETAKNRRNAQTVASLSSAAVAAGATLGSGTVNGVITLLSNGVSATLNGQTVTFQMGALSAAELNGVQTYLGVGGGNVLIYNGAR